jgi:predicted RNA-binding protein with PUA-like domain
LDKPISLEFIKKDKDLKKMEVAKVGQRLSVMPVEEGHFKKIISL